MGAIIPPSMTMVVYGAIAQVSIGGLFLGGIIPGILIGLALMMTSSSTPIIPPIRNFARSPRASICARCGTACGQRGPDCWRR